jgi:hypothetical protein
MGGVFFQARSVPEDHRKFIAAQTGDYILSAAAAAHQACGLAKNPVSDRMAVRIIVMLKIINIKKQQGYLKVRLFGLFNDGRQKMS